MSSFADLPKFDELENKKRFWPAKAGTRDEGLGKLRYLTPSHVAQVVKSEVQTGERVCLNWEMTRLETPGMLLPYLDSTSPLTFQCRIQSIPNRA